jgi:hypothetical protein
MSRMCFLALRTACAMHGPKHAACRHQLPAGLRATAHEPPPDTGGACGASRSWHIAIAFEALRRERGRMGVEGGRASAARSLRANKALIHLRMAGKTAWTSKAERAVATATRMRAAGERAALKRSKRGQLIKALHASTSQRDWARVNNRQAAASWIAGRRVSKRSASGQAGSASEARQAKAQRAHAAEAWAEHELEAANEDMRDRAPPGSEGNASPRAARKRTNSRDRAPSPGLRPTWRPPGTGISSGVLGAGLVGGRLPSMPVRVAGSAHGSAVALGKGVRGKGAFPHGIARAREMAKATAEAARAASPADRGGAGPGRPRPEKTAGGEPAADAMGGDTPAGVPRARAAYGESAGRSRSGPASIP